VPFAIKVELIKANEGGTVSARYSIEREAGGTSYSNPLVFRIGAALENPLPVAHLPQATGSGANVTLAPLDAKTGVTVVVNYSGMNASHFIQLTMTGKPGAGSPPIAGKPGLDSGSVEFLIPPEALAANIGNAATTFTLNYEVIQGSLKIPSLSLTVTVTPLPASELDKLSILQAVGDELDISKLTAGATVSAGVWAFIQVGHPVWLVLIGTNAQGEQHNLVVWKVPGAAVNAGWISAGKYNQGVSYDYFKELADGSNLELHFKAALTSSQVEADAIVAPVKTYRVKAVADVKPVITSVIDSKGIAIPQNSLTVDPNVKVSGTAARNQTIVIYNNGVSTGRSAIADDLGNWNQDLAGLVQGDCNLTAVAQYGSELVSAVWKIIVTPLITPTITSIKDSKGVEIPHGGITVDNRVTITGTASKGQQVDVRDGTASKDKAPVDPTTGAWTLTVSELSIAAYSFTAEALYGNRPVSSARAFTVRQEQEIIDLEDFESAQVGTYNSPLILDKLIIGYPDPSGTFKIKNAEASCAPYLSGKILELSDHSTHIYQSTAWLIYEIRFGAKLLGKTAEIIFYLNQKEVHKENLRINQGECKNLIFDNASPVIFSDLVIRSYDGPIQIDNLTYLLSPKFFVET
jgi:hypothetical protein